MIEEGQIIVQIEYEIDSSENKNYLISGEAFLPYSWDINGTVDDRNFLVSFNSNWECGTVLSFKGYQY